MERVSRLFLLLLIAVGISMVSYTFYKSVILDDYEVVYCDEEDCYDEMPADWLEEEELDGEEYMEDDMPSDVGGEGVDLENLADVDQISETGQQDVEDGGGEPILDQAPSPEIIDESLQDMPQDSLMNE